ncbi:MAG: glycosyltransferase N-terminal domain-containing protein [Gemmatimonadaceae bacterium]
MRFLVRVLYAIAAKLAGMASGVIPPSDAKAAIAVRARHGIRRRYTAWAAEHRDRSRPLLWIHAPSVGEGLMARPVLTLVRSRQPDTQLAYTFFSPSAEEFSRTLDVDFRDYLPFDSAGDMIAALDALAPKAIVFSKVDVWPELVRQANRRGVRLGLISAALAAQSGRRSSVARLLLQDAYAVLDAVGAVDQATAERLVELGVRTEVIEVMGDTRFDQVWQRGAAADRSSGLLARLASERPTLVAGSTWPADEAPLLQAIARVRQRFPALRVILAPHEVTDSHLEPLVRWATGERCALGRVDDQSAAAADVVLVDRYGVLGDLYALASFAFVGGGFHDAGLHSVLEPAAFGAPVLFGPRHHKSRDAAMLLAAGAARAVNDATEIERALVEWLEQPSLRQSAGEKARATVERGTGAAEKSVKLVERLLSS